MALGQESGGYGVGFRPNRPVGSFARNAGERENRTDHLMTASVLSRGPQQEAVDPDSVQ